MTRPLNTAARIRKAHPNVKVSKQSLIDWFVTDLEDRSVSLIHKADKPGGYWVTQTVPNVPLEKREREFHASFDEALAAAARWADLELHLPPAEWGRRA